MSRGDGGTGCAGWARGVRGGHITRGSPEAGDENYEKQSKSFGKNFVGKVR